MVARTAILPFLLLSAVACTDALDAETADPADPSAPSSDYLEGEEFDELFPGADTSGGKEDSLGYTIPDVEALPNPEIIVSLNAFTVHLFDRTTGFSEVYPAGVGVLGSNGSISPTGHFNTSSNTSDGWYYTEARWSPAYYAGLPFLRIDARNSRGQHTYGLHGPIDATLNVGYVSHGCIRMRAADIVELFWRVRLNPSTPVTWQDEPEVDADGNVVAVGMTPVLYGADEEIQYGASAGQP